jgi:hypothetical protein
MTIVSLSGPKPLIAVACCFAVGLAVKQWRREGVEVVKRAPYLLYAAVSVIFFAATVGKVGGSTNYLIEPWFALLMWMAFALRDVHAPSLEHPAALAASGVLALACVAALATDHDREYSWVDAASNTGRARHYARLREEVEALGFDNPSVLSFFVWDGEPDLRVFAQSKTYMITDHVNLNDAFLYELLWEAGALDIRAMVTAIEGQSFDLIITPKELRWARTRGALQPNYETLMAPVLAHYRLASTGEGHRYYVRRDGQAK